MHPLSIPLAAGRPHVLSPSQTSSFKSVAATWLACSSTTEPLSTRAEPNLNPGAQLERELKAFLRRAGDATAAITPLECPIVWARESNAFDCVSRSVSVLVGAER